MNSNQHEVPVPLDQGQVAMVIAKAIGSSMVSLSRSQITRALWHLAAEENGGPFGDDAGCDWYTDDKGNTFIASDWGWHVSKNPNVAALIDAINVIHYGRPYKMVGTPPDELGFYVDNDARPSSKGSTSRLGAASCGPFPETSHSKR